jgi:hypothetical protein
MQAAPALEPLRPKGLELTHVSIVPEQGNTGRFLVNRHFVVREAESKYPLQESWEGRSFGEALELVGKIMAMEGLR